MEGKFENPLRLPLPFRFQDLVVVAAEYDCPRLGAIADVKKYAEQNVYKAAKAWIEGGVISFIADDDTRVEEKKALSQCVSAMPIQSAEALTIAMALLYNEDDYVEGIYECPLCHNKIRSEYTEEYDTRDRVSDLTITCADEIEDSVVIDLEAPIVIGGRSRATKEAVALTVTKLELRHPTIQDGINGQGKYGARDRTRQQFAYYVESLLKINDEVVSQKEKSEWGMMIFENMRRGRDMKALGLAMSRYGINNTVKKWCGCGKEWEEEINTASFFYSALRLT